MRRAMMSCVLLLAAACSAPVEDVREADEGSEGEGTEILAWAGGVVSYGREVRLHVPAGSMARDARIAIARLASVPPRPPAGVASAADGDRFLPSGQGYELTPHGTAFALAQPAKISIALETSALLARGLDPRTAQLFHYDEEAERYVGVAGVLEGDTLVAALEHFSKYVVMAQAAALGDPGPAVAMQAPVPALIRAGAPIYLRATVLPAASTSIAAVRVHYRKLHPPGQAYAVAVMTPDSSPATPGTNTYGALVPAAVLGAADLAAGADFEYFAEATDTLGVTRAAVPMVEEVTRVHVPGSLSLVPAALDISAGFERWLPLMAQDDLASAYQLVPESVAVTACPGSGQPALGEVRDARASGVHFAARGACTGTLSASAGGETASVAVTVRRGHLAKIELYRYERIGGTEVRTRFDGTHAIAEGQVLEVDALGEDGHGNTMHVNVSWQADAALGTIDGDGKLYTLDGGGFGRITASVGGLGGVEAVQWFQVLGRSWRSKGTALDTSPSAPWVAIPKEAIGFSGLNVALRLSDDRVLFLSRNAAQLFHPGEAAWSLASPRHLPRIFHAASVLRDGRALLTGGVLTSQSELFDPATRTWTSVAPLPTQRFQHQQVTLRDGRVLVMGTSSTAPEGASVEAYDPALNRWTARAPMNTYRSEHVATVLADGRVLVTGGLTRAGMESSAEIYDPAANTWTLTASMSRGRRQHAQVLLPNGNVLVLGGAGTPALASAEIYDPISNTWTPALPMSLGRAAPGAAALPDGRVLVVGGSDGSTVHSSATIYDPGSGTWSAAPAMLSALSSPQAIVLSSGRVLVASPDASSEVFLPSQPAPQPSMAAVSDGVYAAWHEPAPTSNRVRVKRWLGTSWAAVGSGSIGTSGRESSHPRLAVNPLTGSPHVAFLEQGAVKEVRVAQWDGMSWILGPALNVDAARDATAPSLAFSGPTPHVAWQEENATASQIYVRRWSGVAWQQLGGSLNRDPTRHATAPVLAVDGANLYVAWQEAHATGSQLFVARWDGAAWVGVGEALNAAASSSAAEPSLMLVNRAPLVAWREVSAAGTRVHVARWDGVAWIAEGTPLALAPASSTDVATPRLSSVFGTPYLAMRELAGGVPQLVVKHRSGGGWAGNGGSLNLLGDRAASPASLVFLGSTPWVSWAEANGVTHSVHVKALE